MLGAVSLKSNVEKIDIFFQRDVSNVFLIVWVGSTATSMVKLINVKGQPWGGWEGGVATTLQVICSNPRCRGYAPPPSLLTA